MSDPFRERIENLLREGKISPEEANKLFKALETQGETVDKSVPVVGAGNAAPPVPPTPATPPTPPTPPAPQTAAPPPPKPEPAPQAERTESHNFTFDGPLNRLVVSATTGDITVEGHPGNRLEVTSNGVLSVTREDGDRTIRVGASGKVDNPTEVGFLDTVFQAIGRVIPVSIKVKVPANLAQLEVKALAGDVDVRGIAGHANVSLQAGDLTVEDVGSFEVQAKAGDVKVNTKLESGNSSLSALAGDVKIRLKPGSSVGLKASNTAGDLSAKGFILTATDKRVTGGSLEGRLGAARAKLDVRLTAGDLDVIALEGEQQ